MKTNFFLIIQIARLCHEANREYCKSIGDDTQLPWEQAPLWQKISAVKGVLYHLWFYPAFNPQASHESWLREKEAAGWKYGEVKDAEAKTHPCFVPYDQLPTDQKIKDALFINIIHAVVKSLGAVRIEPNGDPAKRGDRIVCDIDLTEEMEKAIELSTVESVKELSDSTELRALVVEKENIIESKEKELAKLRALVDQKEDIITKQDEILASNSQTISELEKKVRLLSDTTSDTPEPASEPNDQIPPERRNPEKKGKKPSATGKPGNKK